MKEEHIEVEGSVHAVLLAELYDVEADCFSNGICDSCRTGGHSHRPHEGQRRRFLVLKEGCHELVTCPHDANERIKLRIEVRRWRIWREPERPRRDYDDDDDRHPAHRRKKRFDLFDIFD